MGIRIHQHTAPKRGSNSRIHQHQPKNGGPPLGTISMDLAVRSEISHFDTFLKVKWNEYYIRKILWELIRAKIIKTDEALRMKYM